MKKIVYLIFILNFIVINAESLKKTVPVPIIFSSPETGLGIGAMFLYYSYPDAEIEKTDIIRKGGAYFTTKNQKKIFFEEERNLNENYKLFWEASYADWVTKFYGIGQEKIIEIEENIDQQITDIKLKFSRKIIKDTYLGISYIFNNYLTDEATLSYIKGGEGGLFSGFGFNFLIDKRDSSLYTKKGIYFSADYNFYNKITGSDENFEELQLDFRYFKEIFKNNILAFQANFDSVGGSVPYQKLPDIGGKYLLRGIIGEKYIDNKCFKTQLEYRFPIYKNLGGTLFYGIGQVYNEDKDFDFDNFFNSYGFGLRYTLDKQKNVNIRLDIGFNNIKDEEIHSGLYLDLLEAF